MSVVVIDPGHGGHMQIGSSSPLGSRGPNGTLEKDVTLRLAERVVRHLGSDAVLTRTGDSNMSLAERAQIARRLGARVFVSLHASGPGTTTYVHPRASARSRELASTLQRSLGGYGCPTQSPVVAEMALLSPRHHAPSTAACLIEVDHLASAEAEHRLGNPGELDRLGRAIAGAIRTHLARRAYGDAEERVACVLSADPGRVTVSAQSLVTAFGEPEMIEEAFSASRRTLTTARSALQQLRTGIATTGRPRNDFEERVMISVGRWLHAPTSPLQADREELVRVLDQAIRLFDQNLAVRTTSGGRPPMSHTAGATFHGSTTGDPDTGVEFGDPFFTSDGPKCRRDVVTHEFFHLVGVHHGDGASNMGVSRSAVTTSAGALDSADHLAQLVSEIMDGTTDACPAGR